MGSFSLLSLITSFFITFGFLLAEPIENKYIYKRQCAKSRFVLILGWMLISFLLTISYKSVLLSTLISISHERTIETVEDLLETDKLIVALGNSTTRIRLKTDPRANVRELAEKVNWYTFDERNTVPDSIIQG